MFAEISHSLRTKRDKKDIKNQSLKEMHEEYFEISKWEKLLPKDMDKRKLDLY